MLRFHDIATFCALCALLWPVIHLQSSQASTRITLRIHHRVHTGLRDLWSDSTLVGERRKSSQRLHRARDQGAMFIQYSLLGLEIATQDRAHQYRVMLVEHAHGGADGTMQFH